MIESIRIRNFKSLRDVTVTLDPVTVLIGRSGTGKTNFVQALRFLRDFLTRRDHQQLAQQLGGWQYLLCATRSTSAKLSFEVRFHVPGVEGVYAYALAFKVAERGHGADFCSESLRIDNEEVFAQADGKWTQPPKLVDAPSPGRPAFGLLYGIPEARIAHVVLTKGLGCYDFPRDALALKAQRGGEDTGLVDDGSNYLRALDAINTNLTDLDREKDMRAALRKLNASVVSVDLVADRSQVRVSHKVGDAKILSFDLRQESEGFRRFLAHMITLFQQPAKQVLVFEEPENGIYPGALSVLADQFQAAAESGRSQVILTTHSPQLLKRFQAHEIRVVTMEKYETAIGPVASEQRESLEEHLMTADELLTVDEARIDSGNSSA